MLATVLKFENRKFPGLNGILKLNRYAKIDIIRNFRWIIKSQTKNRHLSTVRITFTRYACSLQDWDNFAGGFKYVGDALVREMVIVDDKPAVVLEFLPKQVKVKTKAEERTMILIEDLIIH